MNICVTIQGAVELSHPAPAGQHGSELRDVSDLCEIFVFTLSAMKITILDIRDTVVLEIAEYDALIKILSVLVFYGLIEVSVIEACESQIIDQQIPV